jgi:HK97 family phage major capsid protein
VGVDGGYLVPTEFATRVAALSLDADAFLPRCDSYPVSGNSITYPSDETTPWGNNGVRAYWAAEAAAAQATKPVWKPNTMRLNKLWRSCRSRTRCSPTRRTSPRSSRSSWAARSSGSATTPS